jgi:hypothetical protein
MGGKPNRQNLVGAAWTLVDSLKILENARHELLGTVRRMIPDNGNRVPGDLSIGLPSKVEAFLPEGTWSMLRPTLDAVRDLDRKIHYFRQGIERLADTYFPETWALRQVSRSADLEGGFSEFISLSDNHLRFPLLRMIAVLSHSQRLSRA